MTVQGHLGIDLGTSAVKVLILDDDGRALARTRHAYPTHAAHPGWAEQSPTDWWQAVCAATREAITVAGTEIASVGLSGQLNGFVLLDKQMQPLADAIIWLDVRAEAEASRLAEMADFPTLTGNALSAICVLPKLAWLGANRPDLLDRTHRIALAKDYILLRLTGVLATDPSDAQSTGMAEAGGKAWVAPLAGLAGIDAASLPPILPSATEAGTVRTEAAAATGLATGTCVATGAGDVAALAVGCGVVSRGRTALTLGTAGHVVAEATAPRTEPKGGLWQIPHAIFGRGLWLGLIMSGGLSLSWFRTILGVSQPPDFETLERLAAAVPAGAGGATFLPFLEGAATPYNRPDVRGAFLGLSSAHGTGHLVRAVMEGVAFNARDCIEALQAAGASSDDVHIAEGGAQSALWCQIIADVLDRPVQRITERDTSAAGAAILGQAAATGGSIAEIAQRIASADRLFEPEAGRTSTLDEAYRRYRDTCARMIMSQSPPDHA